MVYSASGGILLRDMSKRYLPYQQNPFWFCEQSVKQNAAGCPCFVHFTHHACTQCFDFDPADAVDHFGFTLAPLRDCDDLYRPLQQIANRRTSDAYCVSGVVPDALRSRRIAPLAEM